MTPEEKAYVLSIRDKDLRKLDAKKLQTIYNKYNGTQQHSCMCSAIERKAFSIRFFVWYDQKYPTLNDTKPTE